MHLKKCTEPSCLSGLNGLKWFINNAHRTKELTMTIGFDTCMSRLSLSYLQSILWKAIFGSILWRRKKQYFNQYCFFTIFELILWKDNIWVNIVREKKYLSWYCEKAIFELILWKSYIWVNIAFSQYLSQYCEKRQYLSWYCTKEIFESILWKSNIWVDIVKKAIFTRSDERLWVVCFQSQHQRRVSVWKYLEGNMWKEININI